MHISQELVDLRSAWAGCWAPLGMHLHCCLLHVALGPLPALLPRAVALVAVARHVALGLALRAVARFWLIALPFVRLDRGILMWIQLRLRPMVLPVSFQILTSLYQWRVMMS